MSAQSADISFLLGASIIAYIVLMFGVSIWAKGQINNTEDYLVAGRRLPLSLAWATLFATWFGAGTLLTATDEVRANGLRRAALDPFGAGCCLLLAGAFFAAPLWRMKLLTLADFYKNRYGDRTEVVSSLLMVPGYTGWIAAQFVALAGVLNLFFGLNIELGIILVAAVGTGYTFIGGMWSVTLTDAIQICLVFIGLFLLGYETFNLLGDGALVAGTARLVAETPEAKMALVPTEDLTSFVRWMGLFCAGSLGNIPGQDLMQRVFASKSERVAKGACFVSGGIYVTIGALPLFIGLGGNILFPDAADQTILPYLAQKLLTPWMAVVFLLAIMSAVLSTIDSAILSPASVISQNLLSRLPQKRFGAMALNHVAVMIVALTSLAVAYMGENAYSLLESAYELGLVSLLVPLTMGLYRKIGSEKAALMSMAVGTGVWFFHHVADWDFFLEPLFEGTAVVLPVGIMSALVALMAFEIVARTEEVTA